MNSNIFKLALGLIIMPGMIYCDYTPGSDPQMLPRGGGTNEVSYNQVYPDAKTLPGVSPQNQTTNIISITPEKTLNPDARGGINSPILNGAGIYPIGGQLFVDRYMSINTVNVSSVSVSTSLTIPNGVLSHDAAAYGQIGGISGTNSCGYIIGSITQIVTGNGKPSDTTTSASFTSTSSSLAVTPKCSTDNIVVFVHGYGKTDNAANTNAIYVIQATDGQHGDSTWGLQTIGATSGAAFGEVTMFTTDLPASSAQQTYSVQFKNQDGLTIVRWGLGTRIDMMALDVAN